MASKTIIAAAISNELETLAAHFADSLAEGRALQSHLGEIAQEAARLLKAEPDNLAAFVDATRQLCKAHELTEGTVDKTLSHLRGVIRAILGGYEPEAGLTLRAMYDAIPKDASKGGPKARTPRQTAKGAQDAAAETAKPGEATAAAVTKADLIRGLFGHYDDGLLAAMEYAIKNESMFTRWAEASAKAAQTAVTPLRRAA